MGTFYLIASAGLLLLEIILQLYVVVVSSRESGGLFVALLGFVIAPAIVVNSFSAIQVTRTKDFTGKNSGRVICVVFHSFQCGIFWRALKLVILYDKKDWMDYLNMRLFHCGFQSLPFAITLSHTMFRDDVREAARIITVIVTLLSAAFALTLYRTGNKVYEPDGFDVEAKKVRKHVGISFLLISTSLMLLSRCSSIVLFSVVQPKWIALPIGLHFLVYALSSWCRTDCDKGKVFACAVKVLCLSFVNIFDMAGKDYGGVKCSYVLFYSAMLIENLVMSSYWMLTSESDERFRLMTVLVVIMCFIVGVIVKFASCGCIFNVESDILSDAFNNPELKDEKDFDANKEEIIIDHSHIKSPYDTNEPGLNQMQLANERVNHNTASLTVNNRVRTHSPHTSPTDIITNPTMSQKKVLHSYENQAFAKSQGNISVSIGSANELPPRSRSRGSHERSHDSHTRSRDSQNRSRDSHRNSHENQNRSRGSSKHGSNSNKHSHDSQKRSADGKSRSKRRSRDNVSKSFDDVDYSFDIDEPSLASTIDISERTRTMNRQRLKVSDKSIHAPVDVQHTPLQQPKFKGQSHSKAISNADLASSNSRYSRNTNTLNGSVQNYHYNGFNDPFREKRLMAIAKQKMKYHKPQGMRSGHASRFRNRRADFSLDSSELYPSMSSDTSSMTSSSVYHPTRRTANIRIKTENNRRNKNRRLPNRNFAKNNDGYSTDVSNSDYLSSLNDFSMTDSGSWTESSSSSDGALTWPPSHSSNLLKMYNIPDKVSSQENVMHWLDTMDSCLSEHDSSFSTMREPSIASETDISLSAMQTFEVKKDKKRFKRLIPKPKDVILKFRSLNYKGKEKHLHDRPYPLSKASSKETRGCTERDIKIRGPHPEMTQLGGTEQTQVDIVQESIV